MYFTCNFQDDRSAARQKYVSG